MASDQYVYELEEKIKALEKRIESLNDIMTGINDTLAYNKRALYDMMFNLDSENIREIDADITEVKNLKAETIVTETVVTESLYAERGYIAELTVDQLITGNKIVAYKNSNTSDINYLKVYEQYIQFITASVTDPIGTEQATDRNGNLLYWRTAEETATTTTVTNFPVLIYTYTEFIKQQISFFFDNVSGEYVPKIQLGTGSGVGDNGKAFIWKDTEGLRLQYTKFNGDKLNISLEEDGVHIDGRIITDIDLYTDGMFTTYDDDSEYEWSFTKDIDGKITQITNDTLSTTTTIDWNDIPKP